jgi:Adenylate and Guanylate cyclase catalytic domain
MAEGERKTVTALFADIKGSTELMRDLDPEDARAIIDPALRLMIDAAHRYDGYVVQSTGDGIFALFGAPVAHEDHPQRALHAAIAMRDELGRGGEELRRQGQPGVEVRIGINTQLAPNLFMNFPGDADAARRCNTLQTRRHVDAIAVNLLAFHHHVAQVDPDAKFHPASGGKLAFSVLRAVWISTAHSTAFTTLANSASTLSPAELTKRPRCCWIRPSISFR